jgi:predicted nucleic acid-binding protein
MNYLLDVNVLLAWGWADHTDHQRVDVWIAERLHEGCDTLLTSAIPQLGFARVSVQRGAGQVTLPMAGSVLAGMIQRLGAQHRFLPDDQPSNTWPEWCRSAGRTTDAHLLQLATAHGALLATLDEAIPGAFLLPPL